MAVFLQHLNLNACELSLGYPTAYQNQYTYVKEIMDNHGYLKDNHG